MRPPKFWKKRNYKSIALLPFSFIYFVLYILSSIFKIRGKSKLPVICVGNAVVGGSGKTPVSIEIGKILKANKVKFSYLSRGYKRETRGILKVKQSHTLKDIGDEPMLLRNFSDAYVAENRLSGAKAIEKDKSGYQAIIMDDGLQSKTLARDFSILVVNGHYGFGNGFLLPAGPLREPIWMALKKVQLVIICEKDKKHITKTIRKINKTIPIIHANVEPTNEHLPKSARKSQKEVYCFSGIAHPKRFFHTLEDMGYEIGDYKIFDDHHPFKHSEITEILNEAKRQKLVPITTEKDWVRLTPHHQKLVKHLKISLSFDNDKLLKDMVKKILLKGK